MWMMMSTKLVVGVLFCMAVVCAEGANNCEQVLTGLQPCMNYLKQGGAVPGDCCKGVATLNSAASTAAIKRSFCECIKSEARSLGVKSQYAWSLPQKCKVNVGYPISYNVDCASIQ